MYEFERKVVIRKGSIQIISKAFTTKAGKDSRCHSSDFLLLLRSFAANSTSFLDVCHWWTQLCSMEHLAIGLTICNHSQF